MKLRGVRTQFGDNVIHDNLDFDVFRGEIIGLVGGSGTGKSVLLRTIIGLNNHTKGTIEMLGVDTSTLHGQAERKMQSRTGVQFQDGALFSSLSVTENIIVPIREHIGLDEQTMRDIAALKVAMVGLPPDAGDKKPSELSGGMRKRASLARALALDPDFIVCDEPVSALDVSIQSQILNLLDDLQREHNIAYLFIAHNLAVVEHFSDEVAVMYLGRIVEKAAAEELYKNPKHPYTMSLLSDIPEPDPRPKTTRIILKGEVPSPSKPPTGCAFHPRCPLTRQAAAEASAGDTVEIESAGERFRVLTKCYAEAPPLEQKQAEPGHVAACWVTK
jgi:oligopeptide/dipeptide ABC transporter ATP-binding protein